MNCSYGFKIVAKRKNGKGIIDFITNVSFEDDLMYFIAYGEDIPSSIYLEDLKEIKLIPVTGEDADQIIEDLYPYHDQEDDWRMRV